MGNSEACKCDDAKDNEDLKVQIHQEAVQVDILETVEVKESRQLSDNHVESAAPSEPVKAARVAFDVVLQRTGAQWSNIGLTVSPDDDPRYLTIDDVEDQSLISAWNDAHALPQKVRAGDVITSVNGSVCDALGMYNIIQSAGRGSTIRFRIEPRDIIKFNADFKMEVTPLPAKYNGVSNSTCRQEQSPLSSAGQQSGSAPPTNVNGRAPSEPSSPPAASTPSLKRQNTLPAMVNGCGCEFDVKAAERSGVLTKSDRIQEHYKKGGLFGSIAGAFGDKKTMYCHHLTASGEFGTRVAANTGVTPKTAQEVWAVLGKNPCHGRFAYDSSTGKLKCGPVVSHDHDDTCNKETCLFCASGLKCPTPDWALK